MMISMSISSQGSARVQKHMYFKYGIRVKNEKLSGKRDPVFWVIDRRLPKVGQNSSIAVTKISLLYVQVIY